jgi:hypothetical protein
MRTHGRGSATLVENLLAFFGQVSISTVGGAGAFYFLMAIYPPNV